MLRVPPLLVDQCHTSCKLPGQNEKESDMFSLSGHIPFAAHVRSNCGWRNRVVMRAPTDSRSVRWKMMKLSNFPNQESKIGTLRGSRVSATKRSCRMAVLLPPQGQITKWNYGLLAAHFPKIMKESIHNALNQKGRIQEYPNHWNRQHPIHSSIHMDHESHPQNELRPGGRTSVSPVIWRDHFHTLNMRLNQSLVDIKSHLTSVVEAESIPAQAGS